MLLLASVCPCILAPVEKATLKPASTVLVLHPCVDAPFEQTDTRRPTTLSDANCALLQAVQHRQAGQKGEAAVICQQPRLLIQQKEEESGSFSDHGTSEAGP